MSSKFDVQNMNNPEKTKNDWNDDDDDNWDDWGDAEEEQEPESNHNIEIGKNFKKTTTAVSNQNITTAENITTAATTAEQPPPKSTSSWGLWGGISSVLSTATEGLGNISSSVSQSLNQVIGVPGPEELARMNAAEEAKKSQPKDVINNAEKDQPKSTDKCVEETTDEPLTAPVFGLGLVTTLGSKVLNTGLDTLEGIGKKTMHILQENDPLLKNKRKMLGFEQERPNLSETLQAAKKDADQLETRLKELKIEKSKEMLRFEMIFENNCGLVHLEALEILSKESTLKLQTLLDSVSGNALTEMRETIDEVTELLDLTVSDCDDSEGDYDGSELNEKLWAAVEDADLQINFDEIVNTWTQALSWINTDAAAADAHSVFANGINALAQTCALEMNKLHKIAELLLVKEHHSTANEVDAIVQLCKQFYSHLVGLTNRYAATLNSNVAAAENDSEPTKTHISTLFAELIVGQQQIEKAYKLFLPILQIGAV